MSLKDMTDAEVVKAYVAAETARDQQAALEEYFRRAFLNPRSELTKRGRAAIKAAMENLT